MKLRLYISGPYTKGDRSENIRNAMVAGNNVMDRGWFPYIPHLTFYQDLAFPRGWDEWMELDLNFLSICHAILRLPGESKGADIEVERAQVLGLLVYNSLQEVPQCPTLNKK